MDIQEGRKKLAVKIMGWSPHHRNTAHYVGQLVYDAEWSPIAEWQPDLKERQAFMVAEKIGGLTLAMNENDEDGKWQYSARFRNGSDWFYPTPALAIFHAALATIVEEKKPSSNSSVELLAAPILYWKSELERIYAKFIESNQERQKLKQELAERERDKSQLLDSLSLMKKRCEFAEQQLADIDKIYQRWLVSPS